MKQDFCTNCGLYGRIHLHHPAFRTPGNMTLTIPLCPTCHNKVHSDQDWAKRVGLIDRDEGFKYERNYHAKQ